MSHVESSDNEQAPAQCAACGQAIPPEHPCDNTQCPMKTAADMRVAAAKASFRLGC